MKKNKTTTVLNIEGEYEEFADFFEKNRGIIYKEIINLYSAFNKTKKRKMTLVVNAKISGFEWNADFNFFRDEYGILFCDVLPYYEEIEDYETCELIKNLHNDLTSTI